MISKKVTWGLLLAWAANDAEEWFTMAPWSRRNGGRMQGRIPGPEWLRREISHAHAHTAISIMGMTVLAASADGARTAGRSRLFQATLAAFGLHGVGHLALSARHKGYTPGVVTAPTVVVPFSLWAWRELGRAGVRRSTAGVVRDAAVLLPVSLAGVHLAARLLTRGTRRSVTGRGTSPAGGPG
ncbi:HXXEE domain-containing protein [Kitasatospora sp. NPDC056138]|uniref:HXXEE domain-containing protein n=1 Tax=Kitasatospora sp. NPDC056138 TaxID=3345724 RepID=UPI0035D8C167